MVSEVKSCVTLTLFLWRQSAFFPSAFFHNVLFVFAFLQLEYDMPRYRFLVFIILHVLQAFCTCSLVSVINFGKFSVIITSNISYVPSSLLSYKPIKGIHFCYSAFDY